MVWTGQGYAGVGRTWCDCVVVVGRWGLTSWARLWRGYAEAVSSSTGSPQRSAGKRETIQIQTRFIGQPPLPLPGFRPSRVSWGQESSEVASDGATFSTTPREVVLLH